MRDETGVADRLQRWASTVEAVPARDVYATVVFDVDPARWHEAVSRARDDAGLVRFEFLTAVDEADGTFRVLVQLLGGTSVAADGSAAGDSGLTSVLIRTRVHQHDVLDSVVDVFDGAAWHEREVAEMFGLAFSGGPTGRLLLGPQLPEHPLRKSFLLPHRQDRPWPGAKEPGESDRDLAAADAGSAVDSAASGRPRRQRRRQSTYGVAPRPTDGSR